MNAISGTSQNYLAYQREEDQYNEFNHNALKVMPEEKFENIFNMKNNSFNESCTQIEQYQFSSETVAIVDPKREAPNCETGLQLNAVGATMQQSNIVVEERSINCVEENNFIKSEIHENETLDQIQLEDLQLNSEAVAWNPLSKHADATQNDVISFEARPQFECVACDKRFIKLRNYNNHLKTHNLTMMPKCDKCDMIYSRAASLERHMEQFHTSPHQVDNQRCRYCQKFYRSKYALNIHMRFHTGDFPCECSTCGKRFSDNGHLQQHIRVKHQQFRFKCVHENCGKIFETDRALRNHGYGHDKSWPFVCAHYGKGMGTKYNCRMHITNRHKIYPTDNELNAMQKFKRKKVSQSLCFQKVPDAKLKYGNSK